MIRALFRLLAVTCLVLSWGLSASAQDTSGEISGLTTTSPFEPPPANDYTFVINAGPGLDTGCTFRNGGPLQIQLPIGRVLGDIARLTSNGLLPTTVRLEFPAYDVDSSGGGGSVPPERDRVSVNGNVVPGEFMSGLNNTWVMQRFDVPLNWFNFAQDPHVGNFPADPFDAGEAVPVENTIRVDIDTLSTVENWCTAIDWIAVTIENPIPPRPWIGAHGIFSTSTLWNSLWMPALGNVGIPAAAGPDMGDLDTIQDNAGKIGRVVEAARLRWGVDQINIVAHSKGGLDSRHFAESSHAIENLVQLGTPNAGSPLADAIQAGTILAIGLPFNIRANLLAGGLGGYQLTTLYMGVYNLFHGFSPKTGYLAIAGDYQPGSYADDTWRRLLTDLIVGPGDVIVPISSVHALDYMTHTTVTSTYPDRGAEHTAMHGDTRFYAAARAVVEGPGAAQQAVPLLVPDVQRTESLVGRVPGGETVERAIPVDAAATTAFVMFASDEAVELSLRDPNGLVLTGALPGLTYDKSAIPGGWILTYAFQGAVPVGTWTAIVRSTGATPIDYSLNAWLEAPQVFMTVESSPTSVPRNGTFTLVARLDANGLPLTGASVNATIAVPDRTATSVVTLTDDGSGADAVANDGAYTGVFAATSQAGVYGVAIQATGPAALPFSREALSQLSVSASTSQIVGAADFGRDTNGNGRFDELVIRVPLTISTSGSYLLAGALADSAGNTLKVSVSSSLTPTDSELELRFDGATIFSRGINGPYTLTGLRLAEIVDGQIVPLSDGDTPYLTAPYLFSDFEGPRVARVGSASAEGIDRDNNGLFDTLRATIGLVTQSGGFYSWSGRLRDMTGREIGLASGQAALSAGQATIMLDFDGRPLGEGRIDGPYLVTDLLVLGPDATLSVANVMTTMPFLASQFEGYVADVDPPELAAQVASIRLLGQNRYAVTVAVTNVGSGSGYGVTIQQLVPQVTSGASKAFVSLVSPTPPAALGDLEAGQSRMLDVIIQTSPGGVNEVGLQMTGVVTDGQSEGIAFSLGGSVAIPKAKNP